MDAEILKAPKDENSESIAFDAIRVLLEKKGKNVRAFDVTETSSVTDYYINVTGRSSTQVAALADEVVYRLGLLGKDALRVEGRKANAWILVDYGGVIVNIFDEESRRFYDLDRHFSHAVEVDITPFVEEIDKKFDVNNK